MGTARGGGGSPRVACRILGKAMSHVSVTYNVEFTKRTRISLSVLRIDKRSPGSALHLGTSIHNQCSCNGIT